jgi:glycosyltransferase involved in cell wall biosynthesis
MLPFVTFLSDKLLFEDIAYWKECKILINKMPGKVKYCGDVLPKNVQYILSQYHALALLTKGENFGHALYESLSVGRPIITSNHTPWKNLQQLHAGWNVDIKNVSESAFAFKALKELSEDGYFKFCEGAYKLAADYYNSMEVKKNYGLLFK